jgi:hypothetical protein
MQESGQHDASPLEKLTNDETEFPSMTARGPTECLRAKRRKADCQNCDDAPPTLSQRAPRAFNRIWNCVYFAFSGAPDWLFTPVVPEPLMNTAPRSSLMSRRQDGGWKSVSIAVYFQSPVRHESAPKLFTFFFRWQIW